MIYHLFTCHGLDPSKIVPARDELARRSALEEPPEQGGGSRDTLFIDMRPACVEEVLPRLLDPSREPPARRG